MSRNGLTDSLDLAEEVRGDELSVANDLLAEMTDEWSPMNVKSFKEEDPDQDIT